MCEFCDNTYTLSDRQRIQLGKELNIDGVVGKVNCLATGKLTMLLETTCSLPTTSH